MLKQLLTTPPDRLQAALPSAWLAAPSASIGRLCARLDALAAAQCAGAELDPALDANVLEQLFDAGLFSLTVPAACGGGGASLRDFVQAMECTGRLGPAYAMTAVPHLCISVKAVATLCDTQRAHAILGGIDAQRRLLAFAITEDNGSDVAAVKTRLSRTDDGGWRLNGRKQWITNLARASHVVVAALCPDLHRAPGATVLVLVELGQHGVSVGQPWHKLCANGSDTADLYFDDVAVAPHQLLGEPGQGMRLFEDMVQSGRLGAAAAAVGMARQALDVAAGGPLPPARGTAIAAGLDVLSASLALAASLGDVDHPEFAMVTALCKHACSRAAQGFAIEIDHAFAVAGQPAPAAVVRATQAMGLFRLLKGPGEIISQHALAAWAPRLAAAGPVGAPGWPRMVRVGLARIARGFADAAAAGGLAGNPARAAMLADAAGAWWMLMAAVMAPGDAADARRRKLAIGWAWQQFAALARCLARPAGQDGTDAIHGAYRALRQADMARQALAPQGGELACA